MDLNYVLLWLVGISAHVGALAFAIRFRGRHKGWLGVFAAILVTLYVGLWWFAEVAGYAAAAVWLLLFIVPMLGQRWVQRLALRQEYGAARRVATALTWLHPGDGWRDQPAFLAVLEQIYRGDIDAAHRQLESLGPGEGRLALFARLQLFRFEGRWREARAWIESHVDADALRDDTQTFVTYVRALGEVGEPVTMLRAYGEAASRPAVQQTRVHLHLFLFSMAGRTEALRSLFDGPLAHFPAHLRDFWHATALQVAGRRDEAATLFERLRDGDDPMVQRASRFRLQAPLPAFDAGELAPELASLLAQLEKNAADLASYGTLSAPPRRGSTRVSWALVAALAGVFVLEIPGGTTSSLNLISLGALVPGEPMADTWWRVVTAAFLHFGVIHLAMNSVALWFLGRYMERLWGGARLGLCFFGSAIGANLVAAYTVTAPTGFTPVVVGASGGVMGVLGALVVLIAVEWRRTGVVLLKRQLWLLGVVVAMQTVFDLFTPRVSTTIHLLGLVIGGLLGLVFARRAVHRPR